MRSRAASKRGQATEVRIKKIEERKRKTESSYQLAITER